MQQNTTLKSTNLSIQLVLCAYSRYRVYTRTKKGDHVYSSPLALPEVLAEEAIALLNSNGYEIFMDGMTWVPTDYADRLANRAS